MTDYDFHTLNDKEFEILVADLISEYEGTIVERFKAGPDQGIDGRFYKFSEKPTIIQCKHWLKSGVKPLISYLKKTESIKVDKLKPERYIFATSLELSPKNKSEINDIFSPHIKSFDDIYGKHEINALITKYKEIEKSHYKLWLSSINVMQSILHADVIGRSKFIMDEIISTSSKYVITKSHYDAIKKIENENVLIITGMPGVGKTSLAEQVSLKYVSNKYQFVDIEKSITEAEKLYDHSRKQIFYFDDFLGRNYLQAIENKEDSHIVNFIKRVSNDNTKKFILTSRTSILNDGKISSDLFKINNLAKNEYEVKVGSYTRLDKGKILYNHIWFGDLDEKYIESIYKEHRYINIIEHNNFNPRLISFITDSYKVSHIPTDKYWGYIEDTLNNPSGIWEYIFKKQLCELDKLLVAIISFNDAPISEKDLFICFKELSHDLNINNTLTTLEFNNSIKLLVGSVINRHIKNDESTVFTLFDPSVGDYVLSLYAKEHGYISAILSSLHTASSFRNLKGMLINSLVSEEDFGIIISKIMSYLVKNNKLNEAHDYSLSILYEIITRTDVHKYIHLDEIISYFVGLKIEDIKLIPLFDYIDILEWDIENLLFNDEIHKIYLILADLSSNTYLDIDEMVRLSRTIITMSSMYDSEISDDEGDALISSLKDNAITQLKDIIHDDVVNNADINEYTSIDDNSSVIAEAEYYTRTILDEFDVTFDYDDVEEIISHVDANEIIESNINYMLEQAKDDYYNDVQTSSQADEADEVDPVIDLFDRG